jgi:hypothetical protein
VLASSEKVRPFTIIVSDNKRIENIIKEIQSALSLDFRIIPNQRKITTGFQVEKGGEVLFRRVAVKSIGLYAVFTDFG